MIDDTGPVTITKQQIQEAETLYVIRVEAQQSLDRYLGTVHTYGGYLKIKPQFSSQCYCNTCVEFGLSKHE